MNKLFAVLLAAVIFALGACASCPMCDSGKVKKDAQKAFDDMDTQGK